MILRIRSNNTIRDLLEQIKEQFDVMDIRKHKRRFLKHLGTNAMIEITEDRYMIGKHIPNDCQGFCFSDHFVSAIHMCFNTVGGESTVMDLGAANGTFVNDIRVDRKTEVPLKTGDIIFIKGLKSSPILVIIKNSTVSFTAKAFVYGP